ncbi:MAG: hypothetical protein PVF24_04770, partial [Desulfobacterales bacterium]
TIGHPIVGDQTYGSRKWLARDRLKAVPGLSSSTVAQIKSIPRQMLHAWRLGFVHPDTGENLIFESPMPEDMMAVIEKLAAEGQKT